MKPKFRSFARISAGVTLVFSLSQSLPGADVFWDGGASGNGTSLGIAENWAGDVLPSLALPDVAVWDGAVAGPLSLVHEDNVLGGTAGNPGLNLRLAATQTSSLTLDSGANTAAIRLNNITLDNGSGLFTLGDDADVFNITLGGAGGQIHTWTNQSAQAAVVRSDVRFGMGGGGSHALHFSGTGNWDIRNLLTPTNGANLSLHKTGPGELVLSGGGTLAAGVAAYGSTSAAMLKEGTTRITTGNYVTTPAAEMVIGGLDAGAGTNSSLILDGGSISGLSWLSVGRGNGTTGAASSNVVLNQTASISTTNVSMGFSATNAVGPLGSMTLNQQSNLTVTGASFFIGESNLSNMTLTLNDSATVDAGPATVMVGRTSGVGSLIVNGGTFDAGSIDVASGTNNTQTAVGTVTMNGGVIRCEGDFRTGFAGNASSQATVNLNAGTLNVASTLKRWMIIGRWDSTNSTVNISGGNLNLNTDTDIRFTQSGNTGTNVINLNSGAITSFSGNQTGLGAGVVDLQQGSGVGNNTFNLNGGTLTIRQVTSAQKTNTAAFNLNGGTLRATGNSSAFVSFGGANQSANILAGGAIIDSNGFNVAIPEVLRSPGGDGGLTKTGAGTLTLSGANLYQGPTHIEQGTLRLTGSGSMNASSGVTISGGARLEQTNILDLTPPVQLTLGSLDSGGVLRSLTVANDPANTVGAGGGSAISMVYTENLTFQGAATLNLRANGAAMEQYIEGWDDAVLTTPGDGPANGQVVVNVSNTGTWAGGTDYPVISYTSFNGSLSDFALGTISGLSPRQSASLVNTGAAIVLRITGDSLRWTGTKSSDWSSLPVGTPFNWLLPSNSSNAEFIEGDVVLFDDNASQFTVQLVSSVLPGATVFNNMQTYTLSSADDYGIDSGSLVKNNEGLVILSMANAYSGPTTIHEGTLQLGDGIRNGSISESSLVTIHGTLAIHNASDIVLSQPMEGAGVLRVAGNAAVTMETATALTGQIQLASGKLNVNHPAALGSTPEASLVISGGILDNTSGAALVAAAAKTQTWAGDFTFAGSNDLVLGGPVTLGGGGQRVVTLQGGTLGTGRVVSTDGTGLTLLGGGVLAITDSIISNISGPLLVAEGATLRMNTGETAAATMDFVTPSLSGAGIVENGGGVERWFMVNEQGTGVFDGTMRDGAAGPLGLAKGGTGSFTFTQPQNFTGRMTIRDGVMITPVLADIGQPSSIGAGPELYLGEGYSAAAGNGTLRYTGPNVTTNRGVFASAAAGYSAIIDTAADLTFTGEINASDGGGFIKLGSGSLTFSNAAATQRLSNGANGGANVNAANIANGRLVLRNGTFTAGGETVVGGQVLTEGEYRKAEMLVTAGATFTLANWISIGKGNGSSQLNSSIIIDGGTLSQTAAASGLAMGYDNFLTGYLASPSLVARGSSTVNIAGSFLIGESAGADASVILQDSSVLNLTGTTLANKVIGVGGRGTLTMKNGTINAGNGLTLARDSGGEGRVELNGGVLETGSIVGGAGSSTLAINGGQIRANASSETFLSGISELRIEAAGATLDSHSHSISVQALLGGDGNGGLTKTGSGTLTLTGQNSYVGNTTVQAGTVVLADGASLRFALGANTLSNRVTGAGTATLHGSFVIDLANANATAGNAWVLVDTVNRSFGSSFRVSGFSDAGNDQWVLEEAGKRWTFSESTATLVVEDAAASGFGSWIARFGLTPENQAPGADPDGDGVSNLMEYVLGGLPNQASNRGAAIQASRTGANFTYRFTRTNASKADPVVLVIEYGQTLSGFTQQVTVPATASTVDGVEFTMSPTADGEEVTALLPSGTSARFFARLKADL